MKIYFVDPNNSTPQINYPIIGKLKENGISVEYFTSFKTNISTYYENVYNYKPRYVFFKLASGVSNKKIRKFIKAISYPFNGLYLIYLFYLDKPQIIHINNCTLPYFDFYFVKILKFLQFPVILTEHNYIEHEQTTIQSSKLKIFHEVDEIICLSDYIKNKFPIQFKNKISVIKHGNTYAKEINLIQQELSHSNKSSKITFLILGLIREYKGIENVIKAYSLLPEQFKENIQVNIIGKVLKKSYLKSLSSLNNNDKSVIISDNFLSFTDMVYNIKHCDSGILPHVKASQSGLPYLFAALNKPLIASNTGALPEQVDKKFALISEPSPEKLSKAMIEMYNKIKNNEITESDFKKFNTANDFDVIIKEYISLYYSLIQEKQ